MAWQQCSDVLDNVRLIGCLLCKKISYSRLEHFVWVITYCIFPQLVYLHRKPFPVSMLTKSFTDGGCKRSHFALCHRNRERQNIFTVESTNKLPLPIQDSTWIDSTISTWSKRLINCPGGYVANRMTTVKNVTRFGYQAEKKSYCLSKSILLASSHAMSNRRWELAKFQSS